MTETGTATLSYPVVQNQSSIGVVHNENNGGAATSKWAKYYSATTTGTIYDAVAVTPKDYNMCAFGDIYHTSRAVAHSFHVDDKIDG